MTLWLCVLSFQKPASGWEDQEQHLLEMFPKCSLSEARSALSIAKGDMEEAVRLIIEGDVQLSPSPPNVGRCRLQTACLCFCSTLCFVSLSGLMLWGPSCAQVNHGKGISSVADQKLKESILEKWDTQSWSHCEQNWLCLSNRHNFASSLQVHVGRQRGR